MNTEKMNAGNMNAEKMNAPMSYSELAQAYSEVTKNCSEVTKAYTEVTQTCSELKKELENSKKEEYILRELNKFILKEIYDLHGTISNQASIIDGLKKELKEYVSVHVRNTTEILKLEEKTRMK
jgi:hypothetical protein